MRYKPIPPIFVIEGNDVGVFRTVGDAQLQLEPDDVRTTQYQVYDSTGAKLSIAATSAGVFISADEVPPDGKAELATALATFLIQSGDIPEDAPRPSFVELIKRAEEYGTRAK